MFCRFLLELGLGAPRFISQRSAFQVIRSLAWCTMAAAPLISYQSGAQSLNDATKASASPLSCLLSTLNPSSEPLSSWAVAGDITRPNSQVDAFTLEGNGPTGQHLEIRGSHPNSVTLIPGRTQYGRPDEAPVEGSPIGHLSHSDLFPIPWLIATLVDSRTAITPVTKQLGPTGSIGYHVLPAAPLIGTRGPKLRHGKDLVSRTELGGRDVYIDATCHIVEIDAIIITSDGTFALLRKDIYSNYGVDSGLLVAHAVSESIEGSMPNEVTIRSVAVNPPVNLPSHLRKR